MDQDLSSPALLDRLVPPGLDTAAARRARVVAVTSAIAFVLTTMLVIALSISGTRLQVGMAVAGLAMAGLAVAAVRTGQIDAAAWITTVVATLGILSQAALDGGIRDPALALIVLTPLAGAMASGLRLAVVNAVLGVAGAVALFALHRAGLAPAPTSAPETLVWYALVIPCFGAVLSAGAGVLYVRHTRAVIDEAETAAASLGTALAASEARYRSLADGLPIGMYRTASDGRVLLANPAMAEMMGAASAEAALDLNAASLYEDPAERVAFQKAIREAGFVRRYETNWRTPGGQVRRVRIDAHVTLSPSGEPLYYEGAVQDVTSERRARAALAQSEARFRALVQHSSDLVVVLDADMRLSYVSPAAKRLLGTPPERLVGRDVFAIVHPDDREAARERISSDLRHAQVDEARLEVRLRHADGHFVFVEGVGSDLSADPAVGGVVVNLRDVTERKRAQAVLVQAKRQAEEVAHLKSTFLANMSHEIRTPLTAILGFSDILADEITDPQQQEFVDLIARSGKRLMETLNSVLDLARLEAGRGEIVCLPMSVGDAAREAADLMGPAAAERGLTITAAVETEGAVAALDDAAFARVLHNLAGNALKFTESGGVTIRVSDGAGEQAGHVVVRVEDTGIGIDEAFLPRLFGEFEQESAGVERTHEGAGLGLAISRQLVERMGGTIRVESAKGVGTVFTLVFPAVGAELPERPARPCLLVVDDNEQARHVAERVLGTFYDVETAASGDEALALARENRFRAVLLDIHLGDTVSGEDVLRDLRADPTIAGLPVVAVTAYSLPGDRARFLALGFDDYVTKPYTRERLLGAVAACLERQEEFEGNAV